MSDLGVVYSFCVIEANNVAARGRAVSLVSKLLAARFLLTDSTYSFNLIPVPSAPSQHPPPPMQQKTSIFTLVRQSHQKDNVEYDQAVIDALIQEAKANADLIVHIA